MDWEPAVARGWDDGERFGAVRSLDANPPLTTADLAHESMSSATTAAALASRFDDLGETASDLASGMQGSSLSPPEAAAALLAVERLARAAERAQIVAAQLADRANVSGVGMPAAAGEARSPYRDTSDFMRAVLHVTRATARRRLDAATALLPDRSLTGEPTAPAFPVLASVVADGSVAVETAMLAVRALRKVTPAARQRSAGGRLELAVMESNLAETAAQGDPELVRACVDRWEAHIDQDGTEPTDAVKQEIQGLFYKGRKFGLHQYLLNADNAQHEVLKTVAATETNPRARSAHGSHSGFDANESARPEADASDDGQEGPESATTEDFDQRSLPQKSLDGIVNAARIALSTNRLPSTGGLRPQVMVTIDYQTLLGQITESSVGTAEATYQGPINPSTIRRIACDADIIPIVLGSDNAVLSLGRSQRLFSVEQRKALIARDGGCTGPGCTVPGSLTEAHHLTPWSLGGLTNVDSGLLVCGSHHHLIHEGGWDVEISGGTVYWSPPAHVDPRRPRLRNTYFRPNIQAALIS